MILRCYSVFDRKALQYMPPFFQSTDGAATRLLSDAVGDPQTNVGRHPADFVLFYIGDYDDQKGQMIPVSPLVHVIDAVALVQKQEPLPFTDNPELQQKMQEFLRDPKNAAHVRHNGGGV